MPFYQSFIEKQNYKNQKEKRKIIKDQIRSSDEYQNK